MSTFDQASRALETEQQRAKGEEAYLSQEERRQLKRILSFPEEFPPEFSAWIEDHVRVNAQITQGQVQGLSTLLVKADKIPATGDSSETTTSFTYTDLATVGPQLQVGAGKWIFWYGCHTVGSAAGVGSGMSVDINGAGATDADSVSMLGTNWVSITRALTLDLSEANNTIVSKYRCVGVGTSTFYRRFLIGLRYGNA